MFYQNLKHSSLALIVTASVVNGCLSASVLGQAPARETIEIPASTDTEQSLFTRIDLDDSGKINWAELHAAYGQQLERLDWGENMVLGRFDSNIDYSLDPVELKEFFDDMHEEIKLLPDPTPGLDY